MYVNGCSTWIILSVRTYYKQGALRIWIMMMTLVRSGGLASPRHVRLFTLKLWNLISILLAFYTLWQVHTLHTHPHTPCMCEHIVHADVISVSSRVNVCKMTSFHCLSNGWCFWACVPMFSFFQTLWRRFMSHQVLYEWHTFLSRSMYPSKRQL